MPEGEKIQKEKGQPKKAPYKQGWTKDEHARFLNGLQIHGKGAWKEIALIVGTRTPTQIQSHAQKYYLRQKQQVKNKRSIHDMSLEDISELDPNIRNPSPQKSGHVTVITGTGPLNRSMQPYPYSTTLLPVSSHPYATHPSPHDQLPLMYSYFRPTDQSHMGFSPPYPQARSPQQLQGFSHVSSPMGHLPSLTATSLPPPPFPSMPHYATPWFAPHHSPYGDEMAQSGVILHGSRHLPPNGISGLTSDDPRLKDHMDSSKDYFHRVGPHDMKDIEEISSRKRAFDIFSSHERDSKQLRVEEIDKDDDQEDDIPDEDFEDDDADEEESNSYFNNEAEDDV